MLKSPIKIKMLNVVRKPTKLGTIMAAPNQAAAKLTNNSELITNQTLSSLTISA